MSLFIITQQPLHSYTNNSRYNLLSSISFHTSPSSKNLEAVFTMKFTTTALLAAIMAASPTIAAPANSVSMMASSPQWTIESMKRVCDSGDKSCTWTFGINAGAGKTTACKYIVTGNPASRQKTGGPGTCGAYTITSGWSGQFGDTNGFTVLSVVDNAQKYIVWPGYTDKQLAGGKVVSPNQSYAPTKLW